MANPYPLLERLAAHRDADLAETAAVLGMTVEEIEALAGLARERGAPVTVAGGRIRLTGPFSLLDSDALRRGIERRSAGRLRSLEVLSEVDSTNAHLLRAARESLPSGAVCVAEYQTEGRGRAGRGWLGRYGASVLLSVHWRFPPQARLGGLSLAVGVAVRDALAALGAPDLGLKWPNDVLAGGRKVAGILIESSRNAEAGWSTVTGAGVNVFSHALGDSAIDQPWTALDRLVENPDRTEVAAELAARILSVLAECASEGCDRLLGEWSRYDATLGKPVEVRSPGEVVTGIGRGIDESGGLVVETPGGWGVFHSGEVSLRIAPAAARSEPQGDDP